MTKSLLSAALATVFAFGIGPSDASAANEPKWDQKAFQAMGKQAQKKHARQYKAAMEAAHPPKLLQAKVRQTKHARAATKAVSGTTDIVYDDGVVTALPGLSSYSWGNRFDTADGGAIPDSATISQIQVYMFSVDSGSSGNAFVSVFDNLAGTTAAVIDSASLPLAAGTFNTIPASSFSSSARIINAFSAAGTQALLVGVWYVAGDTVALGSGTVGGQGMHGMLINDIAATDYQALTGVNALIRLQGSNLPVELVEFTVD